MNMERNHSTFIRDLLVKVVLIILFIFLLTKLFPMPNLTTFYDKIFNENIQTMKDAAEDWFTTDRMPSEVGKEESLTLEEMLNKKLILPFVDKDGKQCDTKKSYVMVKKEEKEYILKVYLSCNGKSDYIIEHIGCYNFCPEGKCETPIVETNKETGMVTVNVPVKKTSTKTATKTNTKTVTPTPSNPSTPTPSTDKYKLQYLYARTIDNGYWTTGSFQNNKEKETNTTKLVDTRTQYTGQKKVEKGTTTYKHVKYAYKDNWNTISDWTDEVKALSDNVRLYAKRTLYHGQRKVTSSTTKYKHIKYGYTDNWSYTDWSTTKRDTSDTVVLDGTRYTVKKTITKTTGAWSGWTTDSTWRTSKPANTSTKEWKGPVNTKTIDNGWKVIYNSYPSRTTLSTYSGNRWNELLYSQMETCTSACNGNAQVRVYYYRVHEKQESYQYQYQYRTYSSKTTTSTDERLVTDKDKYVKDGYTVVKTEYRYKINNKTRYLADTVWTESKTSPAGYVYANESTTSTVIKYENLGKWVTNSNKLGEYTYNVTTRTQYKYRYNNKEKYLADTIWTESKTSPSGYTYTGEYKSNKKTSYVDLGKWVNSKSELGEYTHNIEKRTQYKYKYYNNKTKTESKWFDSNPGGNWVYQNQTRKIKVN